MLKVIQQVAQRLHERYRIFWAGLLEWHSIDGSDLRRQERAYKDLTIFILTPVYSPLVFIHVDVCRWLLGGVAGRKALAGDARGAGTHRLRPAFRSIGVGGSRAAIAHRGGSFCPLVCASIKSG